MYTVEAKKPKKKDLSPNENTQKHMAYDGHAARFQ